MPRSSPALSEEAEVGAAPAIASRVGPPAVARVLGLQRLAGNRAVALALQREPGSAELYAGALAGEGAADFGGFTATTTRRAGAAGGSNDAVRAAMAGATAGSLAGQHPTMAQLGVPPSQVKGRARGAYVGNRSYTARGVNPLPGATRDATTMESTMKANRYTTTFSGRDYTALQLGSSYQAAVNLADPGDALFLYYAGHAWTTGLMGVEATLKTRADLIKATHPYADLLSTVEAAVAKGVHVTLVVDACRSGVITDLARVKEERRLGAGTDERIRAVLSQIKHLRSLLALVSPTNSAPPSAATVQALWTGTIRPALLDVEPCVTTPGEPLGLPTNITGASAAIQAIERVVTRLLDLAHRLEQPPPAPKLPGG